MPEITWSEEEKQRIGQTLSDLDPGMDPRVLRFRERLGEEGWNFVVDYLRTDMRAALYIGCLISAIAREAVSVRAAGSMAADIFSKRSDMRSRDFGLVGDADRRFTDMSLTPAGTGLAELAESLRVRAETEFFGESFISRPADPGDSGLDGEGEPLPGSAGASTSDQDPRRPGEDV